MSANFQFGDFTWLCERAALTVCPLLQTPQGVMPTCYARNVVLGSQVWFQPATSFVHIAALAMTAIMLFHVSSKYTAIGRKEIVMFFYIYMFASILAFFLDSTVIPTSNEVYAWFTAVYAGTLGALYWCIVMNGLVGFQAWEDGTPRSLWLLRISCLVVWAVCFFVSIATFKSWASFTYTRPLGLFVTYLVFPLVCVVFYIVSQLVLVIRTLDDRWVIGDLIFGIAFYAVGVVLLVAFSNTICSAVSHYIDGVFFFTLCMLLTVMMVYKYWDSITKEDLEFSVGSKQAVWEVKEPLNQGNQEMYEDDTTSAFHGGGGSLTGGYGSNYYANYPAQHGQIQGQGLGQGQPQHIQGAQGQYYAQSSQQAQQQYGQHY